VLRKSRAVELTECRSRTDLVPGLSRIVWNPVLQSSQKPCDKGLALGITNAPLTSNCRIRGDVSGGPLTQLDWLSVDDCVDPEVRDEYRLVRVSNMKDRRCKEKLRLLFEYRNATNLYSNRVALMADIAAGLLPKGEFALLSKIANQAHDECVEARDKFYKH